MSKDVKAPYGYRTYYPHLRKNALSVIFVQKWRWKWMIFVWSIVTIFSNKLGITYKTMSMPVFLDSSSYTNAKSSRKNLIKIPFFHLSVTKQPHKLLIFSPKLFYLVPCTPNNRCCNTWSWENGMLKMLNVLGVFYTKSHVMSSIWLFLICFKGSTTSFVMW